jgi:hypothetical protein
LVLALTGDWQGAGRAVETAMPGPQAAALEPFLSRLPSLSLADRALAVHLGHFPGNGRSAAAPAYAQNNYGGGLPAGYTQTPPPPAAARQNRYASLDAISPDESRPAFGTLQSVPEAGSTEPRRIPGAQAVTAAPRPVAPRRASPQGDVPSRSQWSWSRGEIAPAVKIGTQIAAAQNARPQQPAAHRPEPAPAARVEPPPPQPESPPQPQPQPVEIADAATVTAPPVALAPIPAPTPAPERAEPAPARPASTPAPRSRLADVAAALDRIEEDQRARSVRSAAAAAPADTKPGTSRAHARTAAATPPPKPKKAPPADPARHWVQIAGGADRGKLPREFARLKDKAPKLFAGRGVWTATANATNRLLVGPFDSNDEAQEFVNRLAKADLSGFAWSSEAGQKIEKLAAR